MAEVIRFFHLRNGTEKGGATIKVYGDTQNVGSVVVQAVLVSKKDNYCKKTGRTEVSKVKETAIPLRYLPNYLSDVMNRWVAQKDNPYYPDMFNFAIKYFLPKE